MSLRTAVISRYPGEMRNKGWAKFWAANKVHYIMGNVQVANGPYARSP